jgi:hypothetical protein
MITTQREIRQLFWETYPELSKKKITDHSGKVKNQPPDLTAGEIRIK